MGNKIINLRSKQRFFISGRFPGLNEIIAEAKSHPMRYATKKREWTNIVIMTALQHKIKTVRKANIHLMWLEPNCRRDPDNIQAGIKFILDGLVLAGVLKNDGWHQIGSLSHSFEISKDRPGVWVDINEIL